MDRMLYQMAGIIELIAVSGNYADTPEAHSGSVLISQILNPITVPVNYNDPQGRSGVISGVPKQFMPDLLIKMSRPDGSSYWMPIKLLMMSGLIQVKEGADGTYELKGSWGLEAMYSPIVGFPLAQYPFFRDPRDPVGHFAIYLEHYFPQLGISSEKRQDGISVLSLNHGDAELKIGVSDFSLVLAYGEKNAPLAMVLLFHANGAFVSARRANAGTFSSGTEEQIEDLSAVSCRDTGALKRTYRSGDGRDIRVIASRRTLALDDRFPAAVSPPGASVAAMFESAVNVRAMLESKS